MNLKKLTGILTLASVLGFASGANADYLECHRIYDYLEHQYIIIRTTTACALKYTSKYFKINTRKLYR